MAWLKAIGSSIYVYIALAFTALIGYAKLERYKRKKETRRADNAEHNEKVLIKVRDVESDIDEQKLDNEYQAKLKQSRDDEDFGELTDELNEISTDELINNLSGMLNNHKVRNNKDSGKIPD